MEQVEAILDPSIGLADDEIEPFKMSRLLILDYLWMWRNLVNMKRLLLD